MENDQRKITVQTTVNAPLQTVWNLWTNPADIKQWNRISENWHTPRVENDVCDNGLFLFRMETKDGSFGFDFSGRYDKVVTHQLIEYTTADGRKAINTFIANGNDTIITETFEPENETPVEKQRDFCQAILTGFKKYAAGK